jgi:hypothetical protein
MLCECDINLPVIRISVKPLGEILQRINKILQFLSLDILRLPPYRLKFWYCHYRFRKAFPTRADFIIYPIK